MFGALNPNYDSSIKTVLWLLSNNRTSAGHSSVFYKITISPTLIYYLVTYLCGWKYVFISSDESDANGSLEWIKLSKT